MMNNLPCTFEQIGMCPICKIIIYDWEKHFLENHKLLVAYHHYKKIGEQIKKMGELILK